MRFVLAAMLFVAPFISQATELDNEAQVTNEQISMSKDIPVTLVVRVKDGTNQAEVLHSQSKLEASDESLKTAISNSGFVALQVGEKQAGELDQDSSKSSWYFCFNNSWAYPTYYYYNYSFAYVPYNRYYYGGYTYYWYRWSYGWWF